MSGRSEREHRALNINSRVIVGASGGTPPSVLILVDLLSYGPVGTFVHTLVMYAAA